MGKCPSLGKTSNQTEKENNGKLYLALRQFYFLIWEDLWICRLCSEEELASLTGELKQIIMSCDPDAGDGCKLKMSSFLIVKGGPG